MKEDLQLCNLISTFSFANISSSFILKLRMQRCSRFHYLRKAAYLLPSTVEQLLALIHYSIMNRNEDVLSHHKNEGYAHSNELLCKLVFSYRVQWRINFCIYLFYHLTIQTMINRGSLIIEQIACYVVCSSRFFRSYMHIVFLILMVYKKFISAISVEIISRIFILIVTGKLFQIILSLSIVGYQQLTYPASTSTSKSVFCGGGRTVYILLTVLKLYNA